MQTRWMLITAMASLSALGCGDDKAEDAANEGGAGGQGGAGDAGAGGQGGAGGQAEVSLDIAWEPCSLITNGDGAAECATIDAPLDWSDPEGRKIELFVKRKPATGTPRGEVWMLAGGPGQPGSDFEPLVQQLSAIDPTISFYMLDHRGVGLSSRLSCPAHEAPASPGGVALTATEYPLCLLNVLETYSPDELAHFSTTQAARDVGELIELARDPSAFVAVWGGSYGSHWANRYLELYPNQPDFSLLSAVAANTDLSQIDAWFDTLARRYLDACDQGICADKYGATFGESAQAVAEGVLSGNGKTFCAPIANLGWTIPVFKPFVGQLMYSWQLRSLVAPLIFRAARCSPEDVAVYQFLGQAVSGPPGEPTVSQQRWGHILGAHILMSELWGSTNADSLDELQAVADDAVLIHGSPLTVVGLYEGWPRYDAPPLSLAEPTGPVALIHGEYDFIPNTSYQPTVDHFLGLSAQNRFTLIPRASHGLESPTDTENCGLHLVWQSLKNPDKTPDESCLDQIYPASFTPDAALAMQLLGTPDAWEGGPTSSVAPPLGDEARRAIESLSRIAPEALGRLRSSQ